MTHVSDKRVSKLLDHLQGNAPRTSALQSANALSYSAKLSSKTVPLKGKTIFITGASRGIGLSIALGCAREGANVVVAAKTATLHPKLPGTIYTAAKQVEDLGGRALAVVCDIRNEEQVKKAVRAAVRRFGGIDMVVNNASAISITSTAGTTMKRYDLMNSVNARGTFLVTKTCLPYLKQSSNPHILTISPPLNMNPRWFSGHIAYTIAKYGMSMCTLGWAHEFKPFKIASNALWPKTAVATAAIKNFAGDIAMSKSRTPEIMADAAVLILQQPSTSFTGHFLVDEDVLRETGMTDFRKYRVDPSVKEEELLPDYFLDIKEHDRIEATLHESTTFKTA